MKLAFVCVGAGRGDRFGADKLAEKIGSRTVFSCAIAALTAAVPEAPVVAVVASRSLELWRNSMAEEFPGVRLVCGGERRQDSVRLGVEAAAVEGADVVAIHDGARPLVDELDVRAVVEALGTADGAILVARIMDTIKMVGGDGLVTETVVRGGLRLALTPQVFRVASLERAWNEHKEELEWTDESALLESSGLQVRTVVARYPNPKVTTWSDLEMVRALAGEADE